MRLKRPLMLFCAAILACAFWFLAQQKFLIDMFSRPWPSNAPNNSLPSETTPSNERNQTHSLPSLNLLKDAPKCRELFQTGSLVRPDRWETQACKSRTYTWRELRTCLLQRNTIHHITFIGDSRIRQFKNWFNNYMQNLSAPSMAEHQREHWSCMIEQSLLNLRVQIIWQTYVDQVLNGLIEKWISANGTNLPDLVVISIGTWYPRLESEDLSRAPPIIGRYEEALRSVAPLIKEINKFIPVLWVKQAPVDFNSFRRTPQLHNITDYNDITERIFNEAGLSTLWRSAYTISTELFHQSEDFMHYGDNATEALVNILMNFYCNSKLDFSPDDCCSALPSKETTTTNSHLTQLRNKTILALQSSPNIDVYVALFGLCVAILAACIFAVSGMCMSTK